jgi:hypothetical protein
MSDNKFEFINLWADLFKRGEYHNFILLNIFHVPRRRGGNFVGFLGIIIFNIGFEYRLGDYVRDHKGDIL